MVWEGNMNAYGIAENFLYVFMPLWGQFYVGFSDLLEMDTVEELGITSSCMTYMSIHMFPLFSNSTKLQWAKG